jgi:hypothetical protein
MRGRYLRVNPLISPPSSAWCGQPSPEGIGDGCAGGSLVRFKARAGNRIPERSNGLLDLSQKHKRTPFAVAFLGGINLDRESPLKLNRDYYRVLKHGATIRDPGGGFPSWRWP